MEWPHRVLEDTTVPEDVGEGDRAGSANQIGESFKKQNARPQSFLCVFSTFDQNLVNSTEIDH